MTLESAGRHWASALALSWALKVSPLVWQVKYVALGARTCAWGPKDRGSIPNPQAGDLGQLTISPSYGRQCKMGILYLWPGIPVRINWYLLAVPPGDRVNAQHMEARESQRCYRWEEKEQTCHMHWGGQRRLQNPMRHLWPGLSPSIQPFVKYECGHCQQAHVHCAPAAEYLWRHPTSQGRLTSYINTKDNPANFKLY